MRSRQQQQQLARDVTLVSGPVHVPDPVGVKPIRVITARQMLEAVETRIAGRRRDFRSRRC